ncbi:PL29 family lyase N-terminal domain-containing protein [Niabella drilacis]|uniref:DUF4988 domain-containing protein n=1 Tax=Niabella drilacis (strain DSM 25811 / CCM 8410 / CCUG 62505 / LMG 26954 / E90) TaxID=1285928 RepID=A0A1G7B9H7_NIADE|nr:PL29 family lyase N-terminal domain-containing protein [Niabella drilacis]SDE23527.1 protein of unknown function [Niabella drilacis]
MKRSLLFPLLLILAITACSKKDLNQLRNELNDQRTRIDKLESSVSGMNSDIKSLKELAAALQKNISIKSYTAISTGYLLSMSDGSTIELRHGANGANGKDGTKGKDGADAPRIGVKQDTDGQYYWTLAGDFLLQDGQKLKATGKDGVNGTNGANGITPLLQVNSPSNYWMISYDNGSTWTAVTDKNGNLVPATGPQGAPGIPGVPGPEGQQGPAGTPGFAITETGTSVIITYMGVTYTLSKAEYHNTTPQRVVFATGKIPGQTLSITVDAALAERSKVWIDLNNNEVPEAGEKINSFGSAVSYTIGISQTMTIYGTIRTLTIASGQLTGLDVSNAAGLITLDCSGNQLTELDLSKNTALQDLKCRVNKLATLDLSKNTALHELRCRENKLTALDLSKNTLLTILECSYNPLTILNTRNNAALTFLDCSVTALNALDISQNTALTHLNCGASKLTILDVAENTALELLDCRSNQLTALDLSKNIFLKNLYCYSNKIAGTYMDALVNSLVNRAAAATAGEAELRINSILQPADSNTLPSSAAITAANNKKWNLYRLEDDPVTPGIYNRSLLTP